MPRVEIYTQAFCGYCHRAKSLLKKKGVPFTEIDVMLTPGARDEMHKRTDNASTVPQIFIGDTLIGGYDDLAGLDREGRLDALLGLPTNSAA